jgi:hypothetical protein
MLHASPQAPVQFGTKISMTRHPWVGWGSADSRVAFFGGPSVRLTDGVENLSLIYVSIIFTANERQNAEGEGGNKMKSFGRPPLFQYISTTHWNLESHHEQFLGDIKRTGLYEEMS